jgi:hypothetical protein
MQQLKNPLSVKGCQMGYFQTKNSTLGKILEGLATEDVGTVYGHLVHFSAYWYILSPFGIFYGHLVYFVVIWYILWSVGIFFPFWDFVRFKICVCLFLCFSHTYKMSA